MVGPGGFMGTKEPPSTRVPFMFLAMLAGTGVAGILLNSLVYGKGGFRDLLGRLLKWRASTVWYMVALFTAPLLILVVLLTLSRLSPGYLPSIFVVDEKATLLLSGIIAGLVVGVFEEIGWTGFAIPRLRLRYGVLTTGLIVGLLWGAWHYPLFTGSDPGELPSAIFLPILLFSVLPPFRVLMVWVYDRTKSLLMVMLMHASLTASMQILQPHEVAGVIAVTYDLVWAAALWLIVAIVAVAHRGQLSQQPHLRKMA